MKNNNNNRKVWKKGHDGIVNSLSRANSNVMQKTPYKFKHYSSINLQVLIQYEFNRLENITLKRLMPVVPV